MCGGGQLLDVVCSCDWIDVEDEVAEGNCKWGHECEVNPEDCEDDVGNEKGDSDGGARLRSVSDT